MKILQVEFIHISFLFICVNSLIIEETAVLDNDIYIEDELQLYFNDTSISVLFNETTGVGLAKMKITVSFRLFTQSNPENFEYLYLNNVTNLKSSKFDISKSTKIITHGWKGTPNSPSCVLIKDAFLKEGDYNIIIVDWNSAANLLYILSQSYVHEVGLQVALMINFLSSNGMVLEDTTLIGHSLGAHVMGIAGYNAQSRVYHIVGLDPAGPFFADRGPGFRISSANAKYVEILHTNAGLFGLKNSVGHRDFFPNGGRIQPGCKFPHLMTCSHARSYELYVESISNNNKFFGKKCDSYINYLKNQCLNDIVAEVGNTKLKNKIGDFYFKTRSSSPFSLGICGVLFDNVEDCQRSF